MKKSSIYCQSARQSFIIKPVIDTKFGRVFSSWVVSPLFILMSWFSLWVLHNFLESSFFPKLCIVSLCETNFICLQRRDIVVGTRR